jgi:hypothetical protein
MSILINKNTRVVVQGITGRDGGFHAGKMKEYGTQVVAGTSPGKGGTFVNGVPVFNTVHETVRLMQADTSIIFVPAAFACDAIMEAADAGIKLIICIAGKCGWYKDDGCVGLHKSYRFMYGVKYRHTIYKCASFTRRSTCNNLCTVFFHFSGMESTVPAGYTLNNYSSIFIDKDAHI